MSHHHHSDSAGHFEAHNQQRLSFRQRTSDGSDRLLIEIEDEGERELGWSKTQPLLPPDSDSSSSSSDHHNHHGSADEYGKYFDHNSAMDEYFDHHNDLAYKAGKKREKRKLFLACGLCSAFFLMELLGGIYTDSLALFSDSFHMLTDLVSFVISLSAIYIGAWAATGRYNFGYHRAEVVGAFLSIILIYIMTGLLLVEAVHRLQEPERIKGVEMFVVALAGVFMNIFMALTLHDFGHHAGHDHSLHESSSHHHHQHHHHQNQNSPPRDKHSVKKSDGERDLEYGANNFHSSPAEDCDDNGRPARPLSADSNRRLLAKQHTLHSATSHNSGHNGHGHGHHDHGHHHHGHGHQNINIRAAIIHLIGDLVASIGVLIAAIIIMADQLMYPEKQNEFRPVQLADPICTFIFSVFVVATTVPLLRECLTILMERSPPNMDRSELKRVVLSVSGVERVLSAQCWLITMNMPAVMLTIRGRSVPHSHHLLSKVTTPRADGELPAEEQSRLKHDPNCQFYNNFTATTATTATTNITSIETYNNNDNVDNNNNTQHAPQNQHVSFVTGGDDPHSPGNSSSSGGVVDEMPYNCACSKSAISLQTISPGGVGLLNGMPPCDARIIDIRNHDLMITRIQRALWERYRVRREHCSVMIRYDNGDDDGLVQI